MFCRCPGAAPTTLEKTIDPRSESKSAIEPGVPAPWSVSSNPRLSAAGAAMTQPKLLRCDSPRTHHTGGQLWGRTELAESCFCFCQRARAPFEHPHTVPGALHRRTDQPEGIFISPVPSQSPTWLPEESLWQHLLHNETPELQTVLCRRFNCESRCSIPSVLGTDLSLESQFVSLLRVSEEIIKVALPRCSL